MQDFEKKCRQKKGKSGECNFFYTCKWIRRNFVQCENRGLFEFYTFDGQIEKHCSQGEKIYGRVSDTRVRTGCRFFCSVIPYQVRNVGSFLTSALAPAQSNVSTLLFLRLSIVRLFILVASGLTYQSLYRECTMRYRFLHLRGSDKCRRRCNTGKLKIKESH